MKCKDGYVQPDLIHSDTENKESLKCFKRHVKESRPVCNADEGKLNYSFIILILLITTFVVF